jgi:hypothetical protein
VNLRASQYQLDHDLSARRGRDRVKGKPQTLKALLSWAQHGYALEAPAKMHSGARLEDDGDPAMTGEAKSYIGFHDRKEPNDWRGIARRLDVDGRYVTPMRAAVESVPGIERRAFLRSLLVQVFHAKDVTRQHDIPDWCSGDVTYQSLSILWDCWRDRPLARPSWVDLSESQRNAEVLDIA